MTITCCANSSTLRKALNSEAELPDPIQRPFNVLHRAFDIVQLVQPEQPNAECLEICRFVALQRNPGGGLQTKVGFDITSSGVILNPRIIKSSGNRDVDEAVLDAFRRVKSIGPTPNGKSETDWTLIFNVQDEN